MPFTKNKVPWILDTKRFLRIHNADCMLWKDVHKYILLLWKLRWTRKNMYDKRIFFLRQNSHKIAHHLTIMKCSHSTSCIHTSGQFCETTTSPLNFKIFSSLWNKICTTSSHCLFPSSILQLLDLSLWILLAWTVHINEIHG